MLEVPTKSLALSIYAVKEIYWYVDVYESAHTVKSTSCRERNCLVDSNCEAPRPRKCVYNSRLLANDFSALIQSFFNFYKAKVSIAWR